MNILITINIKLSIQLEEKLPKKEFMLIKSSMLILSFGHILIVLINKLAQTKLSKEKLKI